MKNILVSAVAVFLIGATSAQAQSATGERHVIVRYDDLNVTDAQGARALYVRIADASEEVCGYEPDHRNFSATAQYKTCFEATQNRAVASLPFDLMARIDVKPETVAAR